MPKQKSFWNALEPGDIVDIVAPASVSERADFKKALKFAVKFGLTPRYQKDIIGKDFLCSNTDEVRFKHLKTALNAKDSKLIWCLRGGYGSLRLWSRLAKMKKPKQSKLFIGYSDNTAMHLFFNQKWGWPTLHGTMLEDLGKGYGGRREIQDFRNIIYGVDKEIEYRGLRPVNEKARKTRNLNAPVVGGNLAILNASLGTPWQFNPKGKILVLEDIGERGYRVDRMLVQMQYAGVFDGVRAVIFGDFVGGEENRDEDCVYLWRDVQRKFAAEAKFPVLQGLPFGHGAFQRPVPFLTPAKLHLGRNSYLIIKTAH